MSSPVMECNVCMDRIGTYGVIRCGHIYCFVCVSSWAARANKCPLCKTRFNVIKKIGDGQTEFVHVADREAEEGEEIDPVLFGELTSQRPLLRVRGDGRRGDAAGVRELLHRVLPLRLSAAAAVLRPRREVVLRLLRARALTRTAVCPTSCPSPASSPQTRRQQWRGMHRRRGSITTLQKKKQ